MENMDTNKFIELKNKKRQDFLDRIHVGNFSTKPNISSSASNSSTGGSTNSGSFDIDALERPNIVNDPMELY